MKKTVSSGAALLRLPRSSGIAALAPLLAWILTITGALAADWGVAALFERLAKERPAHAQFHERKYLSLLTEPVDSSGELFFSPPDRLEKRTTSPKPETVIVDRKQVTLERGGRKRTLGLRENPGIAVLVESIRSTLAGDLDSLSHTYAVQLEGDASKWRLVLRPLDASLASLVERIEIGGVDAEVRSVEIFQADGDRSVMTISSAPVR
jgi:outer membrane lipoprotein-sorting protein